MDLIRSYDLGPWNAHSGVECELNNKHFETQQLNERRYWNALNPHRFSIRFRFVGSPFPQSIPPSTHDSARSEQNESRKIIKESETSWRVLKINVDVLTCHKRNRCDCDAFLILRCVNRGDDEHGMLHEFRVETVEFFLGMLAGHVS